MSRTQKITNNFANPEWSYEHNTQHMLVTGNLSTSCTAGEAAHLYSLSIETERTTFTIMVSSPAQLRQLAAMITRAVECLDVGADGINHDDLSTVNAWLIAEDCPF